MGVTVTGLQALRDQLTGHRTGRDALRQQLDALGQQMVSEIRARCPVESGALRDSVQYEIVETPSGLHLKIQVGSVVADYAGYVEYGTAHEAARPFVRPVINARRAPLPAEIAAALVQGVSK